MAVTTGELPHERLDVYSLALELAILADGVARGLRPRPDLAEQLKRASASILLNIAEGAGEYSGKDKARFYRMAKRSTTECAALLQLALRLDLIPGAEHAEAHTLCGRIIAALTALVRAVEQR